MKAGGDNPEKRFISKIAVPWTTEIVISFVGEGPRHTKHPLKRTPVMFVGVAY